MKEKHRYTPILKDKAGEMGALKELISRSWQEITPLIELSLPDKSTDEPTLVKELVSRIEKATPYTNVSVLLDFCALPVSHVLAKEVINQLESKAKNAIPVLQFGNNSFIGLASVFEEVAVRLHWRDISPTISLDLSYFVAEANIDKGSSHLILDIGAIHKDQMGALAATIPALLGGMEHLSEWATVTIAATAFPKILEVTPTKLTTLPRLEWQLWQSISDQVSQMVQRLDFGDYAVTHPVLIDLDPKKMTVSPKIVYATEGEWAVLKGKGPKAEGGGWNQCKGLCKQIKDSSYFLGAAYSFGSDQIARCANGATSTGNAMTWKQASTNHHITLVGNQVANQSSS